MFMKDERRRLALAYFGGRLFSICNAMLHRSAGWLEVTWVSKATQSIGYCLLNLTFGSICVRNVVPNTA